MNIRSSGKVVNAAWAKLGKPVLTCKVLQVQKTPICFYNTFWLWMQIRKKKKNQLKKTFFLSSNKKYLVLSAIKFCPQRDIMVM